MILRWYCCPQMWLLASIDQFGADAQCVPALRDFALEDGAHAQFATNCLRIRFLSLEAKGGVS